MPAAYLSPYPAAWVKMPPGALDFSTWDFVDLTRIPGWLLQLWCARLEWKWCLGKLRWPAGNFPWNVDSPNTDPPYDNIITSIVENSDATVTITCSGAHWIGIGRNPWKTTGESDANPPDAPVWIPDGPQSYDMVVEVGPADSNPEDDPDFAKKAVCDAARVVRAHVISRDSSTSCTVAPLRDFVTSNQLTALSELSGKRINFIKRDGEWPVLRWPPWANAEEVERGTVGAYTATSLTIKEDLMPTRRRWVRDRFNPSGGQAYELIVRDGSGIANPASAPTVVPHGTPGTTTYTYEISALNAKGETAASAPGTTTTGAASLNGTDFNRVTWTAITSATGYRLYGRSAGLLSLIVELAAGVTTYDDTGAVTTTSSSTTTPPAQNLTALMRRIPIVVDATSTIASDEVGTVYFAAQETPSWGANGTCVIVRAGERYLLGHEQHQPWRWYAGARDLWWSHWWQQTGFGWLGRTMLSASAVTWDEFDELMEACLPVVHAPAFDNDMISAFDEVCGAWQKSEKFYSPHLYKTLRQIQADQDADASTAIEPGIDYATARDGVPAMTVPILYRKAGVNARTSTTSGYNATTGDITIAAVDLPYVPIDVSYTVHFYDSAGDLHDGTSGTITVSAAGSFTVNIHSGYDEDDVNGRPVDITFGRTRYAPREFHAMFPRTCRIPDMDPREGHEGEVLDRRELIDFDLYGRTGVGMYIRRAPSTTYTPESGKASGPDSFANGDLARWVSTGWNVAVDGPNTTTDEIPPLLPYFDRFYDGLHPTSLQLDTVARQVEGVTGRPDAGYANRQLPATAAASRYRFTDPEKDWYAKIWHSGNGYGHVESGTCTSGSSTTNFVDSAKLIGFASGAFWEGDEFEGFDSPYLHFPIEFQLPTTVEILDPVTGAVTGTEMKDVWHERVLTVTSADGSGVHGSWAEPLPSSCQGKPWRIREPEYQFNRWENRRVRLHLASGTIEVKGIASGPNTFHLLAPLTDPIPLGTSYEILDYVPGTVWQQAAAAPTDGRPYVDQGGGFFWIAPRGNDVHRTGIPDNPPNPFHVQQNENEPSYVKRYGRIEKNDQIRAKHLYDEMVRIENVYRWRRVSSVTWHSRLDPAIAEDNFREVGSISEEFYAPPRTVEDVYADVLADFQSKYTDPYTDEVSGPPTAHASSGYEDSGPGLGEYGAAVSTITTTDYAYVENAYSPYVASEADLLLRAQIDADDSEPVDQFPPASDVYEYVPTTGDPYLALHSDTSDPPENYGADHDVTSKAFNGLGTTLQYHKFVKFPLGALDGDNVRKSGKIGSPTLPPVPQEPAYLHFDSNRVTKSANASSGFYVSQQYAIVRFDVAGGRVMLLT